MKNYINKDKKVYSYEEDISKELLKEFIKKNGLTPITEEEFNTITNPPLTQEQLKTQEQDEFRTKRNELLSECDIEINKLEDIGKDTKELRIYRQALRACTDTWKLPKLGQTI